VAIGQHASGEVGGPVIGERQHPEPDCERLVAGEQVFRRLAGRVNTRSADGHDQASQPVSRKGTIGTIADQVNIDPAAHRCRGLARACARGRRMHAERVGGAFQGSQSPGSPVVGRQHREHLQVAQLSRPGQQIGDQQHAQCGDVRCFRIRPYVRAYSQQARPGRRDLGVRAGAGIHQAKHAPQASVTAPAGPDLTRAWLPI
jgi:hypothetical protein